MRNTMEEAGLGVSGPADTWKVYFDGSFWENHGKEDAGREVGIDRKFNWGGCEWKIPSVYLCSRGIVLDLCRRTEPEKIRAFMEKWKLSPDSDSCENFTKGQRMEMKLENPLHFDFWPVLELNKIRLKTSCSYAVSYNPCLADRPDSKAEEEAMRHYRLDPAYGWVIYRYSFPWQRKCSGDFEIETLFLTMAQERERIPGPHFKTHCPGDSFRFIHPVKGTEYTLTVCGLTEEKLEKESWKENRLASVYDLPGCFTSMSYTLSPKPSDFITVADCSDSDKPVKKACCKASHCHTAEAAAIGIIGGAVGVTAIPDKKDREANIQTVCSALHFKPVHDIEWRIVFQEKRYDDFTVRLL